MLMDYNKYWVWFSRINILNCLQKERLIEKFETPENIWKLSKIELQEKTDLSECEIDEILKKEYREDLEKYVDYMRKNDIKMITILDKNYPLKLKHIYDKPVILFARGNIDLLSEKSIAIVGCRDCTEYGQNISKKLAYDLSKNDFCIVSGLARGIDKFAHLGALEANGKTVAVIGNGLDNIYPYENKNLCERIIQNNGLIVTEYIIGTKPSKMNFPARNRIISGLSDGVIVVEAKEKSGALITAEFALEQGKEVFAVPGNIKRLNSKGTNELIKDGANILTDYKDIIFADSF